MIKVLYVVAGDTSFDEMIYLDAFINQLPSQTIQNHILAPMLTMTHVALDNRNTEITMAKPGFGYEDWALLLKEYEPQVVILCDSYVLLDEDAPDLTYVELEWLDDIRCVVAVMDFRVNLLRTQDDQLALDQYILDGVTPPYVLDYDFLIKVCPPHDGILAKNPKLIQWGCEDLMSSLAIYAVRDEVRNQLGCPEKARLISLVFPVENTLLAMDKDLQMHFPVMIETLIHYLNQLNDAFVLVVVNMPPPFEDFEYDNVHVRFFEALDQHLLNGLFKATELFITESLSYPGLVLSAMRNIPTMVLGSSLSLDESGQFSHAFEQLNPFLQLKLEALKATAPHAIFPYISFPHHMRRPWLLTELFEERCLYFQTDIFNEQRMVTLLSELLNGGQALEQYQEVLNDYRARKLAHTQDAEAIVRKLVTAPPRHLQ